MMQAAEIGEYLTSEFEEITRLMKKPHQNLRTLWEIDQRLDLLERLVSKIESILRDKEVKK